MSTDPTSTDAPIPDEPVDEALHGRSRVTLPPRTPEPAEALAELEAARTEVEPEAPPTYADMLHLLPR